MSDLIIPLGAGSIGIQQTITGENHFDGTYPPVSGGAPVTYANGTNKFTPHTAGGLFKLEHNEPAIITQMHFEFNAAVSYAVSIVNLDADGVEVEGEDVVIAAGTDTRYYAQPSRLVLLHDQAVKVVTSGGTPDTAGMLGRILVTLERSYQG